MDGSVALLYRPFHTTAESRREKQPYFSHRGFVLTWDGRLDNRDELIAELRSDLEANPTDVAIVAAAFDRWETDCFRRIVGDWAVSIWKPEQRELLFAADYMAIRHIFYYLKKDRIWWSTDLSSLVLLSSDKFHIDDDYIAGYFAHDPDAHLTPYREIREVPPGQFVRIRWSAMSVERFWRFSPQVAHPLQDGRGIRRALSPPIPPIGATEVAFGLADPRRTQRRPGFFFDCLHGGRHSGERGSANASPRHPLLLRQDRA